MGAGGGVGEAAQSCAYNTGVVLIPLPKGISKTSSRVGCEKTTTGCTQAPGDLHLARSRAGDDLKTAFVPRKELENPLAQCLGWEGTRLQLSVCRHWAEELGVGGTREYPGLLPSQAAGGWMAC